MSIKIAHNDYMERQKMRKPFIAGNWKMFKNKREALKFAEDFKAIYSNKKVETCICAPFTHLELLKEEFKGTGIKIGAQNVHHELEGAYTGEISAVMLKSCRVDYCIAGHSERRQYFSETDEHIRLKIKNLVDNNIKPILCVGENLEQREAEKQFETVGPQISQGLVGFNMSQMRDLVIAYEPVWAIGTGKTATNEQANEMCGFIRGVLGGIFTEDFANKIRILYGGSVKPDNIKGLMDMPEIDGALVGGASLKHKDFNKITNYSN